MAEKEKYQLIQKIKDELGDNDPVPSEQLLTEALTKKKNTLAKLENFARKVNYDLGGIEEKVFFYLKSL